jgi:uncharacterized protein YdaU (DUF1376 family)
MNYYQYHIGDFRSGTVNMNRLSRWIYRDMLDVYYDTELPLSLDIDILCNELGVVSDEEIKIVERLLKFKFSKTEIGYRNKTCDLFIDEYRLKAENARKNGKLGGRPVKPRDNPVGYSGLPYGSYELPSSNLEESESQTNHKPLTINHKPKELKEKRSKEKIESPASPVDVYFFGVDEQIVKDFKALRSKHKAPITETAMKGFKREADKAKLSLEDAFRICCEQNWRGFKASWIKDDLSGFNGQWWSSVEATNKKASELELRPLPGESMQTLRSRIHEKINKLVFDPPKPIKIKPVVVEEVRSFKPVGLDLKSLIKGNNHGG